MMTEELRGVAKVNVVSLFSCNESNSSHSNLFKSDRAASCQCWHFA